METSPNMELMADGPGATPFTHLAPGPKPHIIQITPGTMFKDGLHIIGSYLGERDWLSSMQVCRHWSDSLVSSSSRGIRYPIKSDGSFRSPPPTRLLHHFTRFKYREPLTFTMNRLLSIGRDFPYLSQLRIKAVVVSEPVSMSQDLTLSVPTLPSCTWPIKLVELHFGLGGVKSTRLIRVLPTCLSLVQLSLYQVSVHEDFSAFREYNQFIGLESFSLGILDHDKPKNFDVLTAMNWHETGGPPNLRYLDICSGSPNYFSLNTFSRIGWKKIEEISQSHLLNEGDLQYILEGAHNLTLISLITFPFKDLRLLKEFHSLRTLSIWSSPRSRSKEQWESGAMKTICDCDRLTHLQFSDWVPQLSTSWLLLSTLPKLTEITFERCAPEVLDVLLHLKTLQKLVFIHHKKSASIYARDYFRSSAVMPQLCRIEWSGSSRNNWIWMKDDSSQSTKLDDQFRVPHVQPIHQTVMVPSTPSSGGSTSEPSTTFPESTIHSIAPQGPSSTSKSSFDPPTAQEAATPPASRLVGIELNPGPFDDAATTPPGGPIIPASNSSPIASSQLTATAMFRDGLHMIYSFLTTNEWLHSVRTCTNWFAAGRTGPCRWLHLAWTPTKHLPSDPSRALVHHIHTIGDIRGSPILHLSLRALADLLLMCPNLVSLQRLRISHVQESSEFIATRLPSNRIQLQYLDCLLPTLTFNSTPREACQAVLTCISRIPSLTYLRLNTHPEMDLSLVSPLIQLHTLIIYYEGHQSQSFRQRNMNSPSMARLLSGMIHLPKSLTWLSICKGEVAISLIPPDLNLPNLTYFDLTHINDIDVPNIPLRLPRTLTSLRSRRYCNLLPIAPTFTRLTSLSLADSSNWMETIAQLLKCSKLTHLQLQQSSLHLTPNQWSQLFSSLPHLSRLNFISQPQALHTLLMKSQVLHELVHSRILELHLEHCPLRPGMIPLFDQLIACTTLKLYYCYHGFEDKFKQRVAMFSRPGFIPCLDYLELIEYVSSHRSEVGSSQFLLIRSLNIRVERDQVSPEQVAINASLTPDVPFMRSDVRINPLPSQPCQTRLMAERKKNVPAERLVGVEMNPGPEIPNNSILPQMTLINEMKSSPATFPPIVHPPTLSLIGIEPNPGPFEDSPGSLSPHKRSPSTDSVDLTVESTLLPSCASTTKKPKLDHHTLVVVAHSEDESEPMNDHTRTPSLAAYIAASISPSPTTSSAALHPTNESTATSTTTVSTTPTTSIIRITPGTMFKDGLHIISSYLDQSDWLSSLQVCHHWSDSFGSSRSREMSYPIEEDGTFRSLPPMRLRHHFTQFETPSTDPYSVSLTVTQLYSLGREFSHLTELPSFKIRSSRTLIMDDDWQLSFGLTVSCRPIIADDDRLLSVDNNKSRSITADDDPTTSTCTWPNQIQWLHLHLNLLPSSHLIHDISTCINLIQVILLGISDEEDFTAFRSYDQLIHLASFNLSITKRVHPDGLDILSSMLWHESNGPPNLRHLNICSGDPDYLDLSTFSRIRFTKLEEVTFTYQLLEEWDYID